MLDLAGGAGRWTRVVMAHAAATRVIGLDLSEAMIDHVRAEPPALRVVRGIALRQPFAAGLELVDLRSPAETLLFSARKTG